jgi:hypothetical protein
MTIDQGEEGMGKRGKNGGRKIAREMGLFYCGSTLFEDIVTVVMQKFFCCEFTVYI